MRPIPKGSQQKAIAAAAVLLSACGGHGVAVPQGLPIANLQPGQAAIAPPRRPDSKIKHVIILVQENRSLNNLFYGFPGAKTTTFGYDSRGQKIELQPIPLEIKWDLAHNSIGFLAACNGTGKIPGTDCRMNGFDKEQATCGKKVRCPNKYPQYGYVPHNETKPYFDMARQYVLSDRMYASNFDASSFVSHQYIIAGQASSTLDYPESLWGCGGGPSDKMYTVTKQRGYGPKIRACFNNTTLGDELDDARLSWAFYSSPVKGGNGVWSAYQAIRHIYYGPDWQKDVISPQTQFFTDVSDGNLRTVSWITPTYVNSDHAGAGSATGPSWVASVVNAIGESKYWNSSAIFIFWDDYGGWYDSEPPDYVDYDGLGLRLPLLIISPYAKNGHVSHVHYEHGSILKFIEERFGLAPLSDSDKRATSPEKDSFDFSRPPRKFVKIKSQYDENFFLNQAIDMRPPDAE